MVQMRLDLSGKWEFLLDADKEGILRKYYEKTYEDVIVVPTTTAEARKGTHGNARETGHLTEPYHFEGYAWYARTLEIPEEYIGSLAQLVIERTRVSYVWIDDRFVGTQDSLTTAHRYDLTGYLTKPDHRLTVMVSNVDYKTRGGHLTSPDTQTNWNGMLGQIALILEPAIWIEKLWVETRAADREINVRFTAVCHPDLLLSEETDADGTNKKSRTLTACLTMRGHGSADTDKEQIEKPLLEAYRRITLREESTEYAWQMKIPEGKEIAVWNEYTPNLYQVAIEIADVSRETLPEHPAVQEPEQDEAKNRWQRKETWTILGRSETVAGFRDLHTGTLSTGDSRIFYLNDLPVMLRGKHDGMIFPMTGYAPMDLAAWRNVFRTAKEYGINHYRFHTCCPPEAAFVAADELGIYLAPELPFWGTVAGENETEYHRRERAWLLEEGFRILREFGNHPSFVIFSLGNELWGSRQVLNEILGQYKAADGRHLYVQGSNNFQFSPVILENDDFFSGVRFAKDRLIRGSYAMCDAPQGHIQTRMPDNCYTYDEAIRPRHPITQTPKDEGVIEIQFGTGTKRVKAENSTELVAEIPVVSHEIGQYEFYPDYDEIQKYTGVLQPENLRIFRERLSAKGMLHMAKPFFWAAGRLAVECYKRELETAFRSRELAGFQLLDLQDFTGQGTALVGILNAFLENKGLVSAEEWREFCNDRVIMLSFPTYVYEMGDVFDYEVMLCNMRPATEVHKGTNAAWDGDPDIRITVELSERGSGRTIARSSHEGKLELTRLKSFGRGRLQIPEANRPLMMRVTVMAADCGSGQVFAKNHYDLYACPTGKKKSNSGRYPVTVTADKGQMLASLRAGQRVLFFGDSMGEEYSVEGTYCTDFWCYPMFASISESMGKPLPVGTMGLYMDPGHPAFTGFPTEGYTAPQWWRIVTGARIAVLDDQPVEPLIWMIDHFTRNHKLGLAYEARVGSGSLLVCQANLPAQDSPESNRFYDSLLAYASSEDFSPQAQIEEAWLEKVY